MGDSNLIKSALMLPFCLCDASLRPEPLGNSTTLLRKHKTALKIGYAKKTTLEKRERKGRVSDSVWTLTFLCLDNYRTLCPSSHEGRGGGVMSVVNQVSPHTALVPALLCMACLRDRQRSHLSPLTPPSAPPLTPVAAWGWARGAEASVLWRGNRAQVVHYISHPL